MSILNLFVKKGEQLLTDGMEGGKKIIDTAKEKVKQELTNSSNKETINKLINGLETAAQGTTSILNSAKSYLEDVKDSKTVTLKDTERKVWWYDLVQDNKFIVKDASADWDMAAGVKIPKENIYDVVSGTHKGKKIMKEDCI